MSEHTCPSGMGALGAPVQLSGDQSECYAAMLWPLRAGKEAYDNGETARVRRGCGAGCRHREILAAWL